MAEKKRGEALTITLVIVAIIIIIGGVFLYLKFSGGSDDSVVRIFPSTKISPGAEFKIEYHVNLNSSQGYYLFEDAVPKEIQVTDCQTDANNKIKNVVIQGATSRVYVCTLKAPTKSGKYSFKGEYALSNMKNPSKIKGERSIVVS